MPALLRGGSAAQPGPRGKAPTGSTAAPSGRSAKGGAGFALSPAQLAWLAILLLGLAGGLGLATGGRGQALTRAIDYAVDTQFARLGFKLKAVRVRGASTLATADILKVAGVYKDQPLFSIDMEDLRRKVESVGWVKDVRIVRLLPDTLMIQVVEHRQLAVWQDGGTDRVIDERGMVIQEADARQFGQLPLVVGEGASTEAGKILTSLVQYPGITRELKALVRVDQRRWDLQLKGGGLIQLPALSQESALKAFDKLDRESHLLATGFARIDLRNPDVIAVQPRLAAPEIRATEAVPSVESTPAAVPEPTVARVN